MPQSDLPPRELWPAIVRTLPSLQYPETINLAEELLQGGGANRRTTTAFLFHEERISYDGLASRVRALAGGLNRAGVQPGDRVAFRLPNGPDFVALWLAVQWVGAIGVPIPLPYRRREIAHIVTDSGATVAACSDELRAGVEDALPDGTRCRMVRVEELKVPVAGLRPPCPVHRDGPALITYITSTDGPPKGVVHSPAAILAAADTYAHHVLALAPGDICIGPMSLAWAFGLGALLVFPLRAGATAVLLESASLPLAAAIAATRATVLFNVPTAYRMLLQQLDLSSFDLTSLRCSVSAAEPLPRDVALQWQQRTGREILDGLGTTEMMHIFISARAGAVQPDRLGTLVPGYEARIVDEGLADVADGVAGQLAVRGPTGCLYWRRPDLQRHAVRDGWTLTGDICVRHRDGSFQYLRRADDLIVSAGYKISPREVEAVLAEHPAVARARVSAVADPVRGAIATAHVVPASGIATAGLVEALQQYLKRELAPFKCPRVIRIASGMDGVT